MARVETVTVDDNSGSPWSSLRLPALKKTLAKRLPDLEVIKGDIPLIKNLHPSFWRNPNFLHWQLLRLNEKYQRDVDALWYRIWTWFAGKKTNKTPKIDHELLYKKFPPVPPEAFEKWRKNTLDRENFIFVEKAFNAFADFPPYPEEPFEEWYEEQYYNRTHPVKDWYQVDNLLSLPVRLDLLKPPPIPWVVRFPLPHFLENIPPQPNKKGRPQDWALNLLVYELSQARMKNMEIARLLFGVDKSTEYRPDYPKHPILVKIAKTKNATKKIVLESFPFAV